MNHPEVTQAALHILRRGDAFQWYVIPLLALVLYVYINEISNKNWKGIASGLSLYMTHWFFEIINALIQHFFGHALWTVSSGTAFLILIGVGIELSLMFAIAGLVVSKLLPENPQKRYFGINNRLMYAILNAAFFSVFEIFLAKTPAFTWVYPWWGAFPVFIFVYVPFFLVAMYASDWRPKIQKTFIITTFLINAVSLTLFAGILKWI